MSRQALAKQIEKAAPWELPLDYTVLPVQRDFLFDFDHRFTAYGGGLGNGKTTAGCARAWLLSSLFPGNTGYVGRHDGKECRQTTMAEFKRLIPSSFIEKSNDQLGYLKFKRKYGGSEIFYGDLKEERFNNINLGWFFVDQAEEIDEARWNLLVSRTRKQTLLYDENDKPLTDDTGNQLIAQTYGFATFNPEGSSSYLYKFFHADSKHRPCTCDISTNCLQHDYQLYQASTYDGLRAGFVNQQYVDGMLSVFPENARRRYLDGSWDVFEGRIYPEFSVEDHVLSHVKLQPHWKLYESIDHGIMNPTAVQWWAIDEYGNRYLLDEHYEGDGKPIKYHAQVIKAKRAQFSHPIALTWLDSACWANNQSSGERVFSIADEYAENGIFPIPGQKDWNTAKNRITQSLAVDPNRVHPETGQLGSPQIFIAAHCQHFIKEALGYRWKKNRMTTTKNAPDKPMDLNDHHMDAWAYFEASRPQSPTVEVKRVTDPLAVIQERIRTYNPLADKPEAGTWMSV